MKISVDAGALCADKDHRFGNYVVTENLIEALSRYDRKNKHFFYAFCKKTNTVNLQPKIFWSTIRTSIEELIEKKDYYFALNQALPLFTSSKIISFSHGLSFYYHPDLYPDSSKKMKKQHEVMINKSFKIIVPSIKVKNELLSIFKNIKCEIVVIPYGVPFDMIKKVQSSCLPASRANLKSQSKNKFFLVVGMDHPIKNHKILPKDKYKFIIANNVSRAKLKLLYQNATALVTTSLYESFNLPVLEALALGCPIIGLKSAIIPELTKYVNIASDEKQLTRLMELAYENKLPTINRKKIINNFSWKKYVINLLDLL